MANQKMPSWVFAAGAHALELDNSQLTSALSEQIPEELPQSAQSTAEVVVVVPTRYGLHRMERLCRLVQQQVADRQQSGSGTGKVRTRCVSVAERLIQLEPPTTPATYLVEIETNCLTVTAVDYEDAEHVSRLFHDLPRQLLTTAEGIEQLLKQINTLAADLRAPGTAEAEVIFYGDISPCTALATSFHRRKVLAFVLEDPTLADRKYPLADEAENTNISRKTNQLANLTDEDAAYSDVPTDDDANGQELPDIRVEPTVLRPKSASTDRRVEIGAAIEAWWPVALLLAIVLVLSVGFVSAFKPQPADDATDMIAAAATDASAGAEESTSSASSMTLPPNSSVSSPTSSPTSSPKTYATNRISDAGIAMSFPAGWKQQPADGTKLIVISELDLPMRIIGTAKPVAAGITHADLVSELTRLVAGQVTLSELRPEVTIESVMVATYREQPDDRSEVVWHTRLEGDQQISVGCQYRGRLTAELRKVCEQAVASAALAQTEH